MKTYDLYDVTFIVISRGVQLPEQTINDFKVKTLDMIGINLKRYLKRAEIPLQSDWGKGWDLRITKLVKTGSTCE